VAASTPLSTLLSQALVAHTIELDNEFERRFQESGGGARVASFTMWSNLMRFVGDGVTVGDLAAATGLPKSSVLSRIGGIERWRYVSVGSTAKREGYGSARGQKDAAVVRFTAAGRRAAAIWPSLPAEIETRWHERFGAATSAELVGVLGAIDDGLDAELPRFLPIVSSTHGFALDLPPVERRQTAGGQPLVVLLAHALLGYTLEFEESSDLSLPLSANVLRVLGETDVAVRELPALAGISKEAVAVSLTSLVKTDYVTVEGTKASTRTIRLTRNGADLRARHDRLHARIAKRWQARFADDVVARLRASLERVLDHSELPVGLTPYPDGWRSGKAYVARTQAVLADPRGNLPHYPMVLHRGGWPDGS
jgi:DNA-binding MarR family transcriptional regulator